MKAQIQRRENPFKSKYSKEDYDIAREFSTKLYKEFGALIKAIMIFGGESGSTSHVVPSLQELSDSEKKHKLFVNEFNKGLQEQSTLGQQLPQQHQAQDQSQYSISHQNSNHQSAHHTAQQGAHHQNSPQSAQQNAEQFVKQGLPPQEKNIFAKGDIDILIIVDNVSFYLTPDLVEVYRVVTEKLAIETSKRLHITTLRITSFWEYMRVGDPVGINILRSGIALIDTGFIYPMQLLLFEGRIRPSPESVSAYFGRTTSSLLSSQSHLIQATLDLYWASIDASHAAIMHLGEIPTSPREVSHVLHERFVKTGKIHKKYPATMEKMYNLSRKILHREIREVSGKEYQEMFEEVKDFVDTLKKVSGRK